MAANADNNPNGELPNDEYDPQEHDEIHGYRGLDANLMEKTVSPTLFTPGTNNLITVPAIISPLVIFPHQSVPLYINSVTAVGYESEVVRCMLERAKSKLPYIVAIHDKRALDDDESCKDFRPTRGTLIYICTYCRDDIDSLQIEGLAVKRVRIISARTDVNSRFRGVGVTYLTNVDVEVLDEPLYASSYYRNFVPQSILRMANMSPWIDALTTVTPSLLQTTEFFRAQRELHTMLFNMFPLKKAQFVDKYNMSDQSFWFANNFPFDTELRLMLLNEDCPYYRLILIHRLTKRAVAIVCNGCNNRLCSPEMASLVMSVEGSSAIYVNPSGYLHDLLMVKSVRPGAVHYDPQMYDTFAWFVGYKWAPATCTRCWAHIGWVFSNENKSPAKFVALTRNSIKLYVRPAEEEPL